MTHIRLNVPLSERKFTFTPPADYTPEEIPDFASRLLPIGSEAPEFRWSLLNGDTPLALSDARRNRKAVLVVFWIYLLDDSRAELVYLQKHYQRLRERGLEIIALHPHDQEGQEQRYVEKRHFSFPMAEMTPGMDPNLWQIYGAAGFPTNYLIDGPTGKILWNGMGFDEKSLSAALKNAGLE